MSTSDYPIPSLCVTFFSMDTVQILPNLAQGAKLLFVRLRSLGDTLLSTPLYAALKQWRPDLQIFVLIENPYDEILQCNPDVHQIFRLPELKAGFSQALSRIRMLRALRAERFACCINLHGGSTSSLLTGWSGSRLRVGLESFRHGWTYNVRLAPTTAGGAKFKQHTVEHQMGWLTALGLPSGDIPPLKLIPNPAFEIPAAEALTKAGVDMSRSYCVIQPASKFVTKEWTAQGFAEIADYLNAEWHLQVVLSGGPVEEDKLQAVANLCSSHPALLTGLKLSELIWVLHKADLFVGNDSGPTHMAAALQVPVVVLFGSSDSKVWYPWRARHQIVQNSFQCNPCPGYQCLEYSEPHCILSITPAQVRHAIEEILSSHPISFRAADVGDR